MRGDGPATRGDQPGPRTRARQEARSTSNQETIVSDAPRRSRRKGDGGPPEPPGPPTKKGGDGRGGWRRFVPSWKIVVAGFVVLAAGFFGMVMVAYANTPVPTADQAKSDALAQQSTIYFRDGKREIAKLGTKREIVPISKMSQSVRDASVAIENKTFYEDSGISISGMFRSVWMTATGQQLQGASTITQQMARNYYDGLSQEVSIKRKVMEIFVAVKLDEELTKDQILENYLNTINFGRAYGVEAAAKAYFGDKATAAKLTPEQGAYLAARIQQPNWEPDAPELKNRWKTVIQYMAEQWPDKYGQLPQTAKFPKLRKNDNVNELGGTRGYMVVQVLEELKQRGLTPDAVRSGGYHIVSTFDEKLMKAAQTAVKSTTASMSKEYHAGLAAVNPKNGRILAFYGGTNYITDPFNEPFDAKKQAASAFKPYVLAAWLQAGYSLKSYVPGNQTVPKELPGQAAGGFKNSHNVGKAVDVVKATAQSVNTAYVSMAFKLPGQLDDVKNLVESAGFNQQRMEDDVKEHSYQFAIGSALVTPVEQAAGYSIFANEGKYTKYHVVQQVKLGKQVVYGEQLASKRVVDPGVAADATVAMQEVLRSGTAAGKGLGNRPAAGKTGTNNDEKEAWFVGFTPQISAAVGFYREECRTKGGKVVQPLHSNCPVTPGGRASTKYGNDNPYTKPYEVSLGFEGAGPPTLTWQKFMLLAHEGMPVEQFPKKAEVGLAENIVPSPTPTVSKTPDNPFDSGDNPFDDQGNQDCLVNPCDDNTNPDDDVTIDDPGNNGNNGNNGNGNNGNNGEDQGIPQTADGDGVGGGRAPEPRPSGWSPMSRPEDR
ncbi:transglycosylase domain-containing protein [Nonomuraea angiospora]|uniref:transglycosylase domain-containing protein n=1 Tax=Nonomuraea angiospora TaxID=46172 RepID=UPI00344C57BF